MGLVVQMVALSALSRLRPGTSDRVVRGRRQELERMVRGRRFVVGTERGSYNGRRRQERGPVTMFRIPDEPTKSPPT
jgi:hypothetical protein